MFNNTASMQALTYVVEERAPFLFRAIIDGLIVLTVDRDRSVLQAVEYEEFRSHHYQCVR